MDESEILSRLRQLAEEPYRSFQTRLCPGTDHILGVRVPTLRKYAKELLYQYPAEVLLSKIGTQWYEEVLLRGLIIAFDRNAVWEVTWRRVTEFVPLIDNWAICDLFCSSLKRVSRHRAEVFPCIQSYLTAEEEFSVRFALVLLLNYYIEPDTLEAVFHAVCKVRHEGYYVKMAVAWLLSICLVKQYERTIVFLRTTSLDSWTRRKAIQKARESRRLSAEQKNRLQYI